jgi:hypothetical protein
MSSISLRNCFPASLNQYLNLSYELNLPEELLLCLVLD